MVHEKTMHTKNISLVSMKKQRTSTFSSKPRNQTRALNVFKSIYIEPEDDEKFDITTFFTVSREELRHHIEDAIEEMDAVKWHLVVKVLLEKETIDENETITPFFHSNTYSEFTLDEIESHLDEAHEKIIDSFERYLDRGSGWILREVLHFELKVAKLNPLKGCSYLPLPEKLARKKAILNIQNFNDNKCLLWCILAHKMNLTNADNPHRVAKYIPYENTIDMCNIEYPVPYQKIGEIEEKNNLRINVYGYEDDKIYIIRVSEKKISDTINLLLIGDGENNHYCLIRNFSRFVAHRTKHDPSQFYCYRCLHGYSREDLLKEHIRLCKKQAAQQIKMPEKGKNTMTFTGIHLQHPVPFVIYADFEALIVPIETCTPSSKTSYQQNIAQHVACGYSYVIVNAEGKSQKSHVYRGQDAVGDFLQKMMQEKEELGEKLTQVTPMDLTALEENAFKEARTCCICKKFLGEKRVRDHDHISGAYRGAAHSYCNLNFKQCKIIPVIFHNLKNYDAHHLMTKLGNFNDHKIDVIAATLEKYITFKIQKYGTAIQMVFLDSFQFLPASLDKLAQNLEDDQFQILTENFPSQTDLTLLKRKGVYPYEYITSFDKFKEDRLPLKSAFYSILSGENISDEDYAHAQNVWKQFQLKTLGDYHDLYVKTDVLILADVFENFRRLCRENYDIDPAHLLTLPGLSFQSCMKMTGVELELLTDVDMHLFVEQGVRGGVSQISQRLATSNNPQVPGYDDSKDTTYIKYWDANNLYGWAMSQYLPHGAFCWDKPESFEENTILQLDDESPTGYIFEVDLDYPESLHDLHSEYPLAPQRLTVTDEMLSNYAKGLLNKQHKGTPKLIPNLMKKERYITHYRNLKLYLQLGMKLKKIHRVLKFAQSPWLKSYINFNTEKRKNAKSSFEKDFFKLLNNSIYGKCIENLRKRRNIELCNDENRATKLVSSPNYKNSKTFNENLVAVERSKPSIVMNRPSYVGFAILELSKVLMYDFHYNFIKKLYGDRARLLFTDTDSLTYHISSNNFNEEMKTHADKFDFSEYPVTHTLHSITNKKVLGKFKDELCGEEAHQFVGLKAKMYSLKSSNISKKTAKGVSTRIVKQKLNHTDYLKCLTEKKTNFETQTRIGQQSHRLYTIKQNKKCLCPFDDKRFILDDGITSLAYGHYKIANVLSES